MAEGTRAALLGWMVLFDERLAQPARERLLRGELERIPDDVRDAHARLSGLTPDMIMWLGTRYFEYRSVAAIVDGFELFLASSRAGATPDPLSPPTIVFVDLSGFTRLSHEQGDESAVRVATSLQGRSDAAARRYGGHLVKLLGDGALLRLTDASAGIATLDLVDAMSDEGLSHRTPAPLIERDLDVLRQTVNLASRIADVTSPERCSRPKPSSRPHAPTR